MRFFLLLGLLCMMQAVQAAPLTTAEQAIRDNIVKQQAAQVALLKRLVSINSGTTNIAGVKQVGAMVRQQFNQLGFKTRWVYEPADMHRAPTLVAERTGQQGKHVLLIGHLDTVFPATSPFKTITMHENSMKGPGVADDKGGVVVILSALKALNATHALNNKSITVVLTGDEEDSGKPAAISRKPLLDAAKQSDVALDFEPAMTIDTATIGRRGITMWTVETQGNESHSASIFKKGVGDGAIFEMARILNTMRAKLQGEDYVSFNPGMMLGGTTVHYDMKKAQGDAFGKENVVAKTALAKGDLRYLDNTQKAKFEEKMSRIVSDSLPDTTAQIAFQDGIPAMAVTEQNRKLLEQYSDVSVNLDQGKVKEFDPGLRGAGDISYVAGIVPANLAGLGPVGYGSHSVIEMIELPSLSIQTQRAAILIYRLTQ